MGVTATLDMDTPVHMAMLLQPQVLLSLSVDMEHQPPLELMRHMVMLLAEDMLLILSELYTLLRERLMLSLRLMPFMVSTHMVTTTLDSHPTLGQLSPAMPDLLFLDQLFPAIQDQLFQATQGQLSQLSPESLHQLSPAILLQLLPEQLDYGRERLRLSQRLMLMPFMELTHMDTTTLDFQPTPDQLSPVMPDLLFQDQLFPAIPDQSFLATPDQLFLDTPALTELVVCGKMYSHRTANRSSIAIQFKICFLLK